MGGAGAAQIGVRHHQLFDAVAALGGPAVWSWLIDHVERNQRGGCAAIAPGTTLEQLNQTSRPDYRQQALWLDAATGRILAESSWFEPMNFNTMLAPGYGGRFYYMWDQGFIVLQVMPAEPS